jgi:hypothetical protein
MSFFTQAIALSTFLCVCGLIVSEALLYLQQLMSARGFAFVVAVIICWLFLDNLVTANDLQRATLDTTTDGERALLRRMAFECRHNRILQTRLENEILLHLETAMSLDTLETKCTKTVGFNLKRSVSYHDFARAQ